jgi:hypothetical protein
MAFIYKKAMGPHQSPMAFHSISGMALWMTLFKIKVKVVKVNTLVHDFSFRCHTKHIGSGMSRGNFEISGEVQKSFFQIPAYGRQVYNQRAFSEKGCSNKT